MVLANSRLVRTVTRRLVVDVTSCLVVDVTSRLVVDVIRRPVVDLTSRSVVDGFLRPVCGGNRRAVVLVAERVASARRMFLDVMVFPGPRSALVRVGDHELQTDVVLLQRSAGVPRKADAALVVAAVQDCDLGAVDLANSVLLADQILDA